MPLALFNPTITPQSLPRQLIPGLYVHVPFCFHKCHYCDFYSITHQSEDRMNAFVDRILRVDEVWRNDTPPLRPRTVFFGGGTPSLLPFESMQRLLIGLRQRIDLSDVDEWTVEVNPATAEREYCRMLRELGVTRLSFGAQSFDRDELKMLERHHDPADVSRSVEIARAAGFSRINVDLIFGIPGQSMRSWMNSLEAALQLQTPHISCYALTYEPNTPMAVKKRMGTIQAIEESLELEMLRETRLRLRGENFSAYEISNFARPREECRHNLLYWDGGSYIGLGPSASSHVHGSRWKNKGHLGDWERAIDANELPITDAETLEDSRRMREHAMLRLRLAEGINRADFAARWNVDPISVFADPITRYSCANLLSVSAEAITLTEEGVAVADAIAAEFLQSPSA